MYNIDEIVYNQRTYFNTKETLSIAFRKRQLELLYAQIKTYEKDIIVALNNDLNKSEFEAYATEIGMIYTELKYMIRKVTSFAKPKLKRSPMMHFPSTSYAYSDPYGCVLIISPWNYPFNLCISPLIGAIAAGNCAILKVSNDASATAKVIQQIVSVFSDDYVMVVNAGIEESKALLEQRFDYIFFTGGSGVGKIVMEKAAKHLTPVTLELGGKCPCIVDHSANIELSAKRIVWGKLLNAGQTCVAPDYVLVHESVQDELIQCIKKYITIFYGDRPHENDEYPKIINRHHFERLKKFIRSDAAVNEDTLQISPVILNNITREAEVMKEEIFGPILPILTYQHIDHAIAEINARNKPLALYLFTQSKENEKKVLRETFYGGGCVNDTIIHVANHYLPFGGVGQSGMGKYHGKFSFDLFSHTKSVMKKSNLIDLNVRYAPSKNKLKLLRMIFK